MPIYERTADLHKYPTPITYSPDTPPPTHISIGDIHGNALKLIYTLIEEGVLKIDAAQYKTLHDIYLKNPDNLKKKDVDEFQSIISTATVNTTKSITLIGDELADRGQNDYFTLLVLKKLKESRCNVDIMMSNHSIAFMSASIITGFCDTDLATPCDSLANMRYILEKGFIQASEVHEIVDKIYTPMVKAIGYTISPGGQITLFSHAPIGLETVQALAEKFKISYKDDPPIELIKTIDAINSAINVAMNNIIKNRPNNDLMYAICTLMDTPTPYDNAGLIKAIRLVINDKQHALADKELINAIRLVIDDPINQKPFLNSELIHDIKVASHAVINKNPNKDLVDLFIEELVQIQARNGLNIEKSPAPIDLPLYGIFWNRVLRDDVQTITQSGAQVDFVHGHVGPGEIKIKGQTVTTHTNLDNNFGKENTLCSATGDHTYTSRNSQQVIIVRHFTRHSPDIMAHQLHNYMNTTPEFNGIMTVSKQAAANTTSTMTETSQDPQGKVQTMKEAVSTLKANVNPPDPNSTPPANTASP